MMLLQLLQPNADCRMINCDEETKTQHYRGKWRGFGPVRNQEQVILAVFESTRRDGLRLVQNSFANDNLIKKTESVARASCTTRAVFDREIVDRGSSTKGPLVGLACATVSQIRALRADIPTNNGTAKVAALCVLDLVEQGDHDGHATLGYAALTAKNAHQLGKLRSRIRLDLADEFSEIMQPNGRRWPWHMEFLLKRIGSMARVAVDEHQMSPKYKPLLLFLSGLILTSVALVAAAFSVMKDAKDYSEWKLSLLSFMGWMAVTILFGTFATAFIQIRRSWQDANATPRCVDYVWVILPIITGLIAASFLIAFALHQGAHILPS